jgi:hypothetical protein
MPQSRAKTVKLGENHRRVISVVMRGLEQMADDIERWMEKKPGLLIRREQDLSPAQQSRLRTLAAELRRELVRIAGELELSPAVQSPGRSISALLSAMLVQLEESDSKRLRGYGRMPEEAAEKLDGEISHLIALLEQMAGVVEGRPVHMRGSREDAGS